MKILIQSVKIVSAKGVEEQSSDILIDKGRIVDIRSSISLEDYNSEKIIDGSGCFLLPGMFDAHVHFREPGQTHKETIESGSRAALRGGVTGVVMMPNTIPALDSKEGVEQVLRIGEKMGIQIFASACVSKERKGKELTDFSSLKKEGILMLTDDGSPVENADLMRNAMAQAKEMGMFIACHCEISELSHEGSMTEGMVSRNLGEKGIPPCSEEIGIFRDIALAFSVGARVHIQHVSSRLGLEIIQWWRKKGAWVTAEVAPHHLIFSEEDIQDAEEEKGRNAFFKMNPPLRTVEDNRALLKGLRNGDFDYIATDHAPHTNEEKQKGMSQAPFGVIGLETALVSLYHFFISKGELDWKLLVEKFSDNPRSLMGLKKVKIRKGEEVNFSLFNPRKKTLFNREELCSLSENTPFLNKELNGRVEAVFFREMMELY